MNKIKKYISDVGQSFFSLDTSLYWLYLVYFISGIFTGEILFISKIIGKRISDWSLGEGFADTTVIYACLVALLFTLTYLICRRAWRGFVRFIKSSHPEILLIYLAGTAFAFYTGGLNLEVYEKDLINIDGETLLVACLIPFVLSGFFFINERWPRKTVQCFK
jgi:hypothetical protein